MTSGDIPLLIVAGVLAVLAGVMASVESAVSGVSRVRAAQLAESGRAGAARLQAIESDAPRYLNTALLVRIICETAAIVIVAVVLTDAFASDWLQILAATGVMVLVSFIAVGVGPRTVGRQKAETIALLAAAPLQLLTFVLGPVTVLLITVGNALTPGKGFREGPFSTEAELRELVNMAEASAVIESDESRMIHSVFEFGDTLAREVMVPRTDVVFIERNKTLRQAMSLGLRSGFSRIPVIGENLDDVCGLIYLKDVTRRVFDDRNAETSERVDDIMRPAFFVPDSKPAGDLMRDMQANRIHVAILIDEYGGTAGLVTIEDLLEEIVGEITDEYDVDPDEVEPLEDGSLRISSRMSLEDLGEQFGVDIDDEDVETVGGLMAKHLGKVPIPGSQVFCEGLHIVAESLAGRRNKVVTLVVSRVAEPGVSDVPATESAGDRA